MTGILFALGALFAWGFGDFFIQRSSRAVGIWKALFLIGIAGVVASFLSSPESLATSFVRRSISDSSNSQVS